MTGKSKYWLLFVFFSIFSLSTRAQIEEVQIEHSDSNLYQQQAGYWNKVRKSITDSASLHATLPLIKERMQSEGYALGEIDSFSIDSSNVFLSVFAGPRLNAKLYVDSLLILDGQVDESVFSQVFADELSPYLSKGYIFARVLYDTATLINDTLTIKTCIHPGDQYSLDSIRIVGKTKVSSNYLGQIIGLKTHSPFDLIQYHKSVRTIQNTPFLAQEREAILDIKDTNVTLIYFLKKQKAHRFSGILGFGSNNDPLADRKLQFTGNLLFDLKSPFGKGENILFDWRKDPLNQNLQFALTIPYLFKTKFGFVSDTKIHLLTDTFLRTRFQGGVSYRMSNVSSLETTVESMGVNSLDTLNEYESQSNLINLSWQQNQLDYFFNPQKGWRSQIRIGSGFKNTSSEADAQPIKSTLFRGDLELDYYLKTGEITTLKSALRVMLIDNRDLKISELERIGGFRTLRGFDEQAINSSGYAILTEEFRLLLDQNSFAGIFTDIGYSQVKTSDSTFREDWLIGLGGGISFETKAGIFSLYYAVGKQNSGPFLWNSSKVHIGFINQF